MMKGRNRPVELVDCTCTSSSFGNFQDDWDILGLDCRDDILEAIFRVSDLESLKNFRLVCHLWNKEVLRVWDRKALVDSSKGSLVYLYSTLGGCPYPQSYFTALELHFTPPCINTMLKKILEEYGGHLKTIRCTGDTFSSSRSDLTPFQLDNAKKASFVITYSQLLKRWCPNLVSIEVFNSTQLTDRVCRPEGPRQEDEGEKSKSDLPTPLNYNLGTSHVFQLQKIRLSGYLISTHRSHILSLLASSPLLTTLEISFGLKTTLGMRQWEADSEAKRFFLELKSLPNVLQNLRAFSVAGVKIPYLTDAISDLDFSCDKLQSIGICGATNFSDSGFPTFVHFLKKLSSFPELQRLTINKCTCASCEWRNWEFMDNWKDIEQSIPLMANIQHLTINTNGSYRVGTLSLMNKFPNLCNLKLSLCDMGHPNPDRHREYTSSNPMPFDYFFSEWEFLRNNPNTDEGLVANCSNVRHLTVGHTVTRLESINCIQQCFINLTTLNLSMMSDVDYCWEIHMESKLSLPSCVEVLSKLPSLEHLHMTVPTGMKYSNLEVIRTLSVLRNFTVLQNFSVNIGKFGSGSNVQFIPELLRSEPTKLPLKMVTGAQVYDQSYRFTALTATIVDDSCCNITKGEWWQMKNSLESIKRNYRLNWCCDEDCRILARYGSKFYDLYISDS